MAATNQGGDTHNGLKIPSGWFLIDDAEWMKRDVMIFVQQDSDGCYSLKYLNRVFVTFMDGDLIAAIVAAETIDAALKRVMPNFKRDHVFFTCRRCDETFHIERFLELLKHDRDHVLEPLKRYTDHVLELLKR
jgi:hypothetical protein